MELGIKQSRQENPIEIVVSISALDIKQALEFQSMVEGQPQT